MAKKQDSDVAVVIPATRESIRNMDELKPWVDLKFGIVSGLYQRRTDSRFSVKTPDLQRRLIRLKEAISPFQEITVLQEPRDWAERISQVLGNIATDRSIDESQREKQVKSCEDAFERLGIVKLFDEYVGAHRRYEVGRGMSPEVLLSAKVAVRLGLLYSELTRQCGVRPHLAPG